DAMVLLESLEAAGRAGVVVVEFQPARSARGCVSGGRGRPSGVGADSTERVLWVGVRFVLGISGVVDGPLVLVMDCHFAAVFPRTAFQSAMLLRMVPGDHRALAGVRVLVGVPGLPAVNGAGCRMTGPSVRGTLSSASSARIATECHRSAAAWCAPLLPCVMVVRACPISQRPHGVPGCRGRPGRSGYRGSSSRVSECSSCGRLVFPVMGCSLRGSGLSARP